MAPVRAYSSPKGGSAASKLHPHASNEPLHRRKRVKFTTADDSSEPSISDESVLVPTSVPEESTGASDIDTDSPSELSESSEEPNSESSSEGDSDEESELEEQQDEQGIVNLPANRGKKPNMKLEKEELGPDIRGFLKDFLPQLKAANEELEEQRKAGTLKSREIGGNEDEGGAEGQYIEMDLGLGVLEEKNSTADDSSDSDSEDNEGEKDILGKLMGREKKKDVGIQEVHNGQDT